MSRKLESLVDLFAFGADWAASGGYPSLIIWRDEKEMKRRQKDGQKI